MLGVLLVLAVGAVLVLLGRRRQSKAKADRAARRRPGPPRRASGADYFVATVIRLITTGTLGCSVCGSAGIVPMRWTTSPPEATLPSSA